MANGRLAPHPRTRGSAASLGGCGLSDALVSIGQSPPLGVEPTPAAGTGGTGGEERRACGPRAHSWTSHHVAAPASRAGGQ